MTVSDVGSSSARDTSAVYAAEALFERWLDHASRNPGEPLRVQVGADSREFWPETEVRFSAPEDVQVYVDRVLAHLQASECCYPDRSGLDRAAVPITVRRRRGPRQAHYEYDELPARGVMAIPPREVGGAWTMRAAVVLHEVAHHLSSEEGHGAGFRTTYLRLLEDLGMPAQAELLHTAYLQGGLDTGIDGEDRTLLRIGRLLRQAERASTEAERDAFFAKAQTLATRHQIALAVARATAGVEEKREEPTWETVPIGSGQRSLARFVQLMVQIAHANDIRISIFTDHTRVTLYGFATDIAVVKALYVSLVMQMVADADAHLRSGAHKPVHGSTARAAFYEAWSDHVGERLRSAREAARSAAISADEPAPGGSTSTELALRAREVEVHDFTRKMMVEHGVRGSWKGTLSARYSAPASAAAGRRAAARASLGSEPALTARG